MMIIYFSNRKALFNLSRIQLQGSTLIETMIMMLITGILLLFIMDGMILFFKLQTRQLEMYFTTQYTKVSYYRVKHLFMTADSIFVDHSGGIKIWHDGNNGMLSCQNSWLLYSEGTQIDTLFRNVAFMEYVSDDLFDTLMLQFTTPETYIKVSRFVPSPIFYTRVMDKIESGYQYERK